MCVACMNLYLVLTIIINIFILSEISKYISSYNPNAIVPWKNAVFDISLRKRVPPVTDLRQCGTLWPDVKWVLAQQLHAGSPAENVRLAVPWKTVTTRDLLTLLHLEGGTVPLLSQVSQKTWTETLQRPPRPPWYFSRFPTSSYFTQTPRSLHTPYSPTGWGGLH